MRHLFMIEINKVFAIDTTGIIVLSVFGVAVILALFIGIYYFFFKTKNKKKAATKEKEIVFEHSDDKFIEALGGVDNIISYDLRGQARLSVVLKDKEKINKEELKKFYVDRFLEMSDKIILVGENLEPLVKILDKFKSN